MEIIEDDHLEKIRKMVLGKQLVFRCETTNDKVKKVIIIPYEIYKNFKVIMVKYKIIAWQAGNYWISNLDLLVKEYFQNYYNLQVSPHFTLTKKKPKIIE